jgi:hypothetical protein
MTMLHFIKELFEHVPETRVYILLINPSCARGQMRVSFVDEFILILFILIRQYFPPKERFFPKIKHMEVFVLMISSA